ncbi:MAG: dienelactone hydrolase family protein [Jatrophihabitantaceae bacterium]
MPDDNPAQNVTFASNGGQAHGYLAVPAGGTGPGVIVIQEWWGLTDHIVDITNRLAAQGFVALAPDLFGGKTTHDAAEAGKLLAALPAEQAAKDLAGAVDFLLNHEAVTSSKLGAVGFCMGGGFVLMLATQQGDRIGAAVSFYGVGQGVPEAFKGLTAAVQGHYGEADQMYPAEQARAQEAQIREQTGAEVEYFYYPAGHAFHNDENLMGTYDPELAALAWQRTVDFLSSRLS